MSDMNKIEEFNYLLNSYNAAGHAKVPYKEGFAAKRQALIGFVTDLLAAQALLNSVSDHNYPSTCSSCGTSMVAKCPKCGLTTGLTDSSVLREAAQRTDQDYAIEHGGYLATAAEHLLDEINKYDMAQASGEDFDCDARSAAWNSLRSAIGEFRKRAKRALESSSVLREAATTQDDAATRLMAAKFIREHTFPAPGYDCNSTVDLMIAFAMALADSSAPKEK